MALYGESLALPPEMALAAGFTDARPDPGEEVDNPFIVDQSAADPQDFSQSEDVVPIDVANAMGVDARGDFRASSPNALALQYGRNRNVNVSGGRVVSSSPLSMTSQEGTPAAITGQPSDMLTDPQFLNLYKQDPISAKRHYEITNPGHTLENDIKMQQAIEVEKTKFMRESVGRMIDKGLTFDQITGEPTIQREVKDPTNPYSATKIEDHSPLTDSEKALVFGFGGRKGGFELLMGQKPPTGIPAPEGLTPQEAVDFRKQVKASVQTDPRTEIDDKKKLTEAYLKVWNKNRSAQENAKASAANSTILGANPPDLMAGIGNYVKNSGRATSDLIARSANLGMSIMNKPKAMLSDLMGGLGFGTPSESDISNQPPQTSGQQIRSLF